MTLRFTSRFWARARLGHAVLLLLPLVAACGGGGGGGADGGGQSGLGPAIPPGAAGTGANVPADLAVTARAAALVSSCVPDDSAFQFLQRWYYKFDESPDLVQARPGAIECLGKATDGCDAIDRCLGSSAGAICDGQAGTCDGNVATRCIGNGIGYPQDCSQLGETCSGGECIASGAGQSCDVATYQSTCTDGRPTFCAGNPSVVGTGPRCADGGLSCQMNATLGMVCSGSGAACTAGGASAGFASYVGGVSCSGGMLTVCVNGQQATVACTDISPGFSCQSAGSVAFCGVASDCDPTQTNVGESQQESCDGGAVVFCNAGRIEHIACGDMGLQACQTAGSRSRCGPNP